MEGHIKSFATVSHVKTTVNARVDLVVREEAWPHLVSGDSYAATRVMEHAPLALRSAFARTVHELVVVDALLSLVHLDLVLAHRGSEVRVA